MKGYARAMQALLMVVVLAACNGEVTQPGSDPLSNLDAGQGQDVSDRLSAPAGSDAASFSFHGYVLGQPATGSSAGDSLTSWPRVSNVRVTVYRLAGHDENLRPVVGDSLGTTTSDGSGYFRFAPAIEDGEYVLTFVPPGNSGYTGFYWSYSIRAEWAHRLLGIVLEPAGNQ